jgi:hypothetical protein
MDALVSPMRGSSVLVSLFASALAAGVARSAQAGEARDPQERAEQSRGDSPTPQEEAAVTRPALYDESEGCGCVSLELNPLAFFAAKIGGNVEIWIAPHHALTLSPAAQLFGPDFSGFTAETGYRYYSKADALAGFFLGVSIGGGWFSYEPNNASTDAVPDEARTSVYGAAVDVGYQWLISQWFLVSLGAGVLVQHGAKREYELHGGDFTHVAELFLNSGVRPRVLVSTGVAF